MLAGKNVSSLSLFPQYRAVQEAVEAERVHPADLWPIDWRWREIENDPSVAPRTGRRRLPRPRSRAHLLQLMRGTQALTAAARMSELVRRPRPPARRIRRCAPSGTSPRRCSRRSTTACCRFDVFTKRVASRLLAQFRLLSAAIPTSPSGWRATCCSSALRRRRRAAASGVPRLTAARSAYGLPMQAPTDYSLSVLGRFDPAIIVHAKKRVAAAKEAWSATAGGEMHRLAGPGRAVRPGRRFAAQALPLRRVVRRRAADARWCRRSTSKAAPPAALAMEVATSLLYIEAALEDGDFDDPEHADRVRRLGERLAAVRQEPAAASRSRAGWRSSTGASPTGRRWAASSRSCAPRSARPRRRSTSSSATRPNSGVLVDVPVQLASMRGVLSVLGMDQASHALLRMRDEVDGLVSTEVDPGKVAPGRRVRPHRRQPERARLHDRHAERAAAARQVAVRVRRRERERSRP